mgnify:CR=1 FL=1
MFNFEGNKEILSNFYITNGLENFFKTDCEYLENAFIEINELWKTNFNKIREINYIMIAEAPLWGKKKNYIYNPETNNSQFFYRTDLGDVIGESILSKLDFLNAFNHLGIIVLDISPYAFNQTDSVVNYRKNKNQSKGLTKKQYRELVTLTLSEYFDKKLELISTKASDKIKVFFRYRRVKENFEDLMIPALLKHKLIQSQNEIIDISQSGGGVDKMKLERILNSR